MSCNNSSGCCCTGNLTGCLTSGYNHRKPPSRRGEPQECTAIEESGIVKRFREVYCIPEGEPVPEEDILRQWDLERSLRQELLQSSIANRAEVFEDAYTRFYSATRNLLHLVEASLTLPNEELYREWLDVLGPPPLHIYEVGSGKGRMVSYLASLGYSCRATEITSERGKSQVSAEAGISWNTSDGVHLDEYEAKDSYDVVASDQVVEHIHPDDTGVHFRGALTILKPGGRYIFRTPYALFGPWDITRVMGGEEPAGLHLREFCYRDIVPLLKSAGFTNICAVFSLPKNRSRQLARLLRRIGVRWAPRARASRLYLCYVLLLESLLALVPQKRLRRRAASLLRFVFMPSSVFISARK